MGQYLIDNNVISNFMLGAFNSIASDFITTLLDNTPCISIITEIEALSWVSKDASKESLIIEFIKFAQVVNLDSKIVAECVQLRRAKKIKLPDAIIAATAITQNLTLLTSDTDFKNIPNLKVLDPFSL